MQIIPVIDLKNGQVVRAVRGDRAGYQPIDSLLCPGSDPAAMAQRLCEHCATDTLYIADLDALRDGELQISVLQRLLGDQPALRLWLDAGFADADQADRLRAALGEAGHRVTPVFGSESLRSVDALARCFAPPSAALLSLDRRGGQALDVAGLWDRPSLWPQRVIVMSLDRVGSFEGPDLDTLASVRALAPKAQLIGAGGIRRAADLQAAAAAGASAWLVASALHDGRLASWQTTTDCGDRLHRDHSVWQPEGAPRATPDLAGFESQQKVSHATQRRPSHGICFARD
jgi:phosphoribosylformimino-5-aminoimidazole carboxamide ribotide isomerase